MKAAERVEVRQWAGGPSGGREKRKRREWRVGEKKPEISQKAAAVHFRVILDTDT
jgi:hypothetical protein